MARRPALLVAALGVALVVGCSHARNPFAKAPPPLPEPVPVSPWPGIFDSAQRALEARRFGEAERIFAAYAVEHPDTPEAAESEFWRALVLTDPANSSATLRSALTALDTYLARGTAAPRYVEVSVLRRLTLAGDSLRTALATTRTASDARDKSRDDELQKMRDSLDATRAELDRIKRRLTGRKP